MTGKGSDMGVMAIGCQDSEEPSPPPHSAVPPGASPFPPSYHLGFMLPCLCQAMQEVLSVCMPLIPCLPRSTLLYS